MLRIRIGGPVYAHLESRMSYTPPYGQPAPQPHYGHGPAVPPPHQPPPAPEPRNGLGLAGLICSVLAAATAVVSYALAPILFLAGGALAIIGLALGIAGQARVSRGRATNQGVCAAAVILGVIGLLGAINSARVVFTAVDTQQRVQQTTVNEMADCIDRATTPEEILACAD